MNIRTAGLIMAGALVLLAGCGRNAPDVAPMPTDGDAGQAEAPTNRVDIPPMVRNNLGITFAKVERRQVASTIRVPGVLELEPRARREYRMMLPGQVQLLVDQYAPVKRGDPLFRYRSSQWSEFQQAIVRAEQDVALAQAELHLARARLEEERSRLLLLERRLDALTSAEFRRADLEAEIAMIRASLVRHTAEVDLGTTRLEQSELMRRQAVRSAAAAIGLAPERLTMANDPQDHQTPAYLAIDWIEVRAEDDGIVQTLTASDGAYLEPSEMVLATIDPDRVRFRGRALQSDAARLLESQRRSVVIVPPGQTPGAGVGARISIAPEADAELRTITLLAVPEAHAFWMRAGMSALAEIVVESTEQPALAIPRAAIVQDGLTHIFFRRDPRDPNKAIRVEADMGPSDGRWVAIRSGLMLNDEVVVDGVYELKLATSQNATQQRGGHFHADGTWHQEH